MAERRPEQPIDLLDVLGDFGLNRDNDDGAKIIGGIRSILAESGMVVPTLDEISLDGGKTAGIIAAHQAPVTISRETPEVAEWRRQTDRFIELGFYEELQLSNPEAYRLTIPQFFPKPKSFDGRYDRPLAVERRIPLPKLHQLAGIKDYFDTSKITNQIRVSRKPYTIYIANSVDIVRGTFDFAMGQLAQGAVADTFIEVDMAYLRYPELFQSWLYAGNSRFGAGLVPSLLVSGGEPGVGADWVGSPHRGWRLLSRGNKIGT